MDSVSAADTLDETGRRIFAAILQGALKSGRVVAPALGVRGRHSNGFGCTDADDVTGPCCAVGAGVLFAKEHGVRGVLETFAEIHGVSSSYARGVSDGFEADDQFGPAKILVEGAMLGHHIEDRVEMMRQARAEYDSGCLVGDAVYQHYYGAKTEKDRTP
jgi:hypothetical protein